MRKFLIILFIYNPKEKIKKKNKIILNLVYLIIIINSGRGKINITGVAKRRRWLVVNEVGGVCVWYANGFVSFTKKLFIIGLGFLMRPK